MMIFIPRVAPVLFNGTIGQTVITQSQQFIVPSGVENLCAVAVGPGGRNGSSHSFGFPGVPVYGGSAGAGALCWANALPVKPGDVLDVVVGTHASQIATTISINGVVVMRAGAGTNGTDSNPSTNNAGVAGVGGTYSTSLPDSGGGNGGRGAQGAIDWSRNSAQAGSGGAGGYSGKGGDPQAGTSPGGNGEVNSGAGGAGCAAFGGGVGLLGKGVTGLGGTTRYAAGGDGSPPGQGIAAYGGGNGGRGGAVRFIWGPKRAFPSTLTADQTPKE